MLSFTKIEFCQLLAAYLSRRYLCGNAALNSDLRGIFPQHEAAVYRMAEQLARDFPEPWQHYQQTQISPWLVKKNVPALLSVKRKKRYWLDDRQYRVLTHLTLGGISLDIRNTTQLCAILKFPTHRTLDWLVLPHQRRASAISHYRTMQIPKPSGGHRTLEEPRPVLKRAQRLICQEILAKLPVHEAAHGYITSRSILTCVQPHVGSAMVVKMDLQDYFASIPLRRVAAILRRAGLNEAVALALAQLCTNCYETTKPGMGAQLFRYTGLPQGAPTSPMLANLVTYAMDRRLAALAQSADWRYTRYADDLIFSSRARSSPTVKNFTAQVGAIVMEEGFKLNFHKTKIMYASQPQHVLGICINQGTNMVRSDYENLKATIHNCVRLGGPSQARGQANFREVLRGRLAFLQQLQPRRAERLLEQFSRIRWQQETA